jgi:hypothetical protein
MAGEGLTGVNRDRILAFRIDGLLIDELGYLNRRPEQTNIVFKLMEERYHRKPTLLTTNLDYPEGQTSLGGQLGEVCHPLRRIEVLMLTDLPTGALGDNLAEGPSLLRLSKRNTSATATRYMRGPTLHAGRISAAMNL